MRAHGPEPEPDDKEGLLRQLVVGAGGERLQERTCSPGGSGAADHSYTATGQALLPPAPSATGQDDRETPRWTPETGRTETRRARDGLFYSRAEFIAFYGERGGQTRWAEAGAVAAEGLAAAGRAPGRFSARGNFGASGSFGAEQLQPQATAQPALTAEPTAEPAPATTADCYEAEELPPPPAPRPLPTTLPQAPPRKDLEVMWQRIYMSKAREGKQYYFSRLDGTEISWSLPEGVRYLEHF